MEIRTLRVVESVARLKSFSRASQEVCLSVAAVSAAVKRAEADFGAELFERSTRAVQLTPFGERFLPDIRLLLAQHDKLASDVSQIRKYPQGTVTVGCLASIAVHLMPAAISRSRALYPGVEIKVRDAEALAVYRDVTLAKSDFAIVSSSRKAPALRFEPLIEDPFVFVCSARSRFAGRERVEVRELFTEDFIAMSRETGVREVLEQHLGPLEDQFRVIFEVTQLSSVIGMVQGGLGASLIPALAVPRFIPPSLAIVPIDPPIRRSIGLIRRDDRPFSHAIDVFAECVRSVLPESTKAIAAIGALTHVKRL